MTRFGDQVLSDAITTALAVPQAQVERVLGAVREGNFGMFLEMYGDAETANRQLDAFMVRVAASVRVQRIRDRGEGSFAPKRREIRSRTAIDGV